MARGITDAECKMLIDKMKRTMVEIDTIPGRAKELLIKSGIYDENGELTEHYR